MPVQKLPTPTHVDLHRHFGDAAVGKTQGRRLAVLPGGEKRSIPSRIGKAFVRQGARALNVLVPKGQRAEARVREALRDCSHRTGDLVGSLAASGSQTPDSKVLVQQLNACLQTAQRVTESTAALDALIAVSVETRLEASQQAFDTALTGLNNLMAQPVADLDDDAWIVQLSQALETTASTLQFLNKHIAANHRRGCCCPIRWT